MFWLCHLFGHKHLRNSLGYSTFHPDICQRCGELSPRIRRKGQEVVRCKIFGHKFVILQLADSYSPEHRANFCWRCHDLKEDAARYTKVQFILLTIQRYDNLDPLFLIHKSHRNFLPTSKREGFLFWSEHRRPPEAPLFKFLLATNYGL